jgi:hypothetical protein
MATRVDNTMVEWLQKELKNIAEAKLLPDADMPFLVGLENIILERAKKPVNDMRQEGLLPPAQPSGMGSPMGRGGVMGGPSPAMVGGASDELRRILQPAQGPQ